MESAHCCSRLQTVRPGGRCCVVFVGGLPDTAAATLAAAGNPGGWGDLHGVDFAEGAVQFCAAAAGRHPHGGLRFTVGDALALEACAPDSCADVVVDKGCLDCFVSGAGEADVGACCPDFQPPPSAA